MEPGAVLDEGEAHEGLHQRQSRDGALSPDVPEAFARRRCLVQATGFYEWQKRAKAKQPYRIRRRDLEPFAFAGLWEFARIAGEEILSAAIIVTDANALVAQPHDRMPVILSPESYEEWLDPESNSENLPAA